MTNRVSQFHAGKNKASNALWDLDVLCNKLYDVGMEGVADKLSKIVYNFSESITEMDQAFGGHIDDNFKAAQKGMAETLSALVGAVGETEDE